MNTKIPETTKAYLAGLVDGEGHIGMSYSKSTSKYRHPTCMVSSTSIELLQYVQQAYGGAICKQVKYKEHYAQAYLWRVVYNGALTFLSDILPYMQENVKIQRAVLLTTEYLKLTPRNGQYTPQQRELKLLFEKRFHALVGKHYRGKLAQH